MHTHTPAIRTVNGIQFSTFVCKGSMDCSRVAREEERLRAMAYPNAAR